MTAAPRTFQQLLRYGIVGVASNASMYGVYLLLTYWGIEPKTAMTMVYLFGATLGFFGNKQWTFAHRGDAKRAMLRYVVAHTGGYTLSWVLLYVFVDRLGYPHQWVQAGIIGVVAVFLFVVFKFFVFHSPIHRAT
jgi:putative flippase GtrA